MIEDIKEESLIGVDVPEEIKKEECLSLKCCAILGDGPADKISAYLSNVFSVKVKKSEIIGYSFDYPHDGQMAFFLSNGIQLIVADKWNRYSIEEMFGWKTMDSVGF